MTNPLSVTLRDIARTLGISHSTVSRALHGSPEISEALRVQVQEAARSMGYRPNPMATALGAQRQAAQKHEMTAEIAWLNFWHDAQDLRGFNEFDLYWKGAEEVLTQSGYQLEEFRCHGRISASRLEEILFARNIRGILIPPHRPADLPADWDAFRWDAFCVVKFGYSLKFPQTHIVAGNHLRSGMAAYEIMRKRGYERIGFVSSQTVTSRFKAGFLAQQTEPDAKVKIPILLLPDEQNPLQKIPLVLDWIARHKPDAIFSDISGLRQELEKAGYDIPGDIALAGTSILDGNVDSGLDQQSEEIGRAAADLLISLIHRNVYGTPSISRELLIESCWIDGLHLPVRVSAAKTLHRKPSVTKTAPER